MGEIGTVRDYLMVAGASSKNLWRSMDSHSSTYLQDRNWGLTPGRRPLNTPPLPPPPISEKQNNTGSHTIYSASMSFSFFFLFVTSSFFLGRAEHQGDQKGSSSTFRLDQLHGHQINGGFLPHKDSGSLSKIMEVEERWFTCH